MRQLTKVEGYLTVYLSLTMAVLLSLFLVMFEGIRLNTLQMEAHLIADVGTDSILAEYHRELWDRFGLLMLDTSYGTGQADISHTEERLLEYLEKNCETEDVLLGDLAYRDFLGMRATHADITMVQYSCDEAGAVFRELASDAVSYEKGVHMAEQIWIWLQEMRANGILEGKDLLGEAQAATMQMEHQIRQQTASEVENPLSAAGVLQNKGILQLVIEDQHRLSQTVIDSDTLISSRWARGQVNCGNWQSQGMEEKDLDWVERILWIEYLLGFYGSYGKLQEQSVLKYQLEYIIAGKESDVENLKNVVHRICGLREAANALYLFSDQRKCEEADTLALVLASALTVPEIQPILKTVILLTWAYLESLHDVKCLLEGRTLPLLKTAESWYMDVDSVLTAQQQEVKGGSGEQTEKGLGYQDYLRILLALTDLTQQTFRAMDVTEAEIRNTKGNEAFRLDACICRLQAQIHIESTYGYTIHITKRKGYATV